MRDNGELLKVYMISEKNQGSSSANETKNAVPSHKEFIEYLIEREKGGFP